MAGVDWVRRRRVAGVQPRRHQSPHRNDLPECSAHTSGPQPLGGCYEQRNRRAEQRSRRAGDLSVAKRRHRNDLPLMKGGAVVAICVVAAGLLWLSWGSPKKEERAVNTVARQTAGFEPAPPLPPPPAAVPVQFTVLPPTGMRRLVSRLKTRKRTS